MCFFSIIIPVYQAERVIGQCVKGVLDQECKEWELLLVDDGSRDGSGKICDELQSKYENIKAIHKENGGAASARNLGLSVAAGRYILFLDSDDHWENSGFLSELKKKLVTPADICLFGCYDEDAVNGTRKLSRGNYSREAFDSRDTGKILYSLYASCQFPGACWIMAVRRDFLQENRITFPEGNRAEDIDWLLQVLTKAQRMEFLEMAPYIYRKNQAGSITGTAGRKSILAILETAGRWSPRLQGEDRQKYLALNSYLVFEFFTSVLLFGSLSKEEKRGLRQEYKKIKMDFHHVIGKKLRLCGIAYQIFGPGLTSWLLNTWRTIR